MTTQILTLKPDTGFWRSLWHYAAVVPFFAIQRWFAIFLITTGTLYASAMFSMQHSIFPPEIAFPLAVGIEWTYLSGLAYATELRSNRWSLAMIAAGALTSGLYGVLYILGRYNIIPAAPDTTTAILLALAHVAPLILLLIIYTICKRGFTVEQRTIAEAEQRRQREIEDRQRARAETWRDERLQIEIARDRIALDKERARLSRLQQRDNHETSVSHVPNAVPTLSRDALRAAVVTAYRTQGGTVNVSREAKQLGMSRATWYRLREEAIAAGELDAA